MKKRVRLAIIGTGRWGLNYVRVFASLPSSEIRFLVDLNEENLRLAQRMAPQAKTLKDYRYLLSKKGWDAAVVATPSGTHFSIVSALLRAKKDVLVEKPLALNVADAKALVDLAQFYKKKIMVGHILLYHPALRYLKDLIKKGELGRIRSIHTFRFNSNGMDNEEPILFDLACHDIATAIYLFDEYPYAGQTLWQNGRKENWDFISFQLFFPKGGVLRGRVSQEGREKVRRMVIIGEKRLAVFDDTQKKLILKRIGGKKISIPKIKDLEPLRLECQHFLDCLMRARRPLTDGESAFSVIKILSVLNRSLKAGGKILEVN